MTAPKSFSPHETYADADAFLGTRHSRVLRRNLYVARDEAKSAIALVLHSTAILTWHADGRRVIWQGGWDTVATRKRINDYLSGPGRVSTVAGVAHYWHPSDSLTAPKLQKCRTCHGQGGWVRRYHCFGATHWGDMRCRGATCRPETRCYGYGYGADCCHGERHLALAALAASYGLDVALRRGGVTLRLWAQHDLAGCEHGRRDDHPVPCEHGRMTAHLVRACAHGNANAHDYGEVRADECHRCAGAGVADYGSKQLPTYLGSSSALELAPDGSVVGKCGSPWYAPAKQGSKSLSESVLYAYAPPSPAPPVTNAGTELSRILPGLSAAVRWPCGHAAHAARAPASVYAVVIHLNDSCDWSRERIAAWLETLSVDLRFPTPA